MTPEQKFNIHKKTGKMPQEKLEPSKYGNLYLNGELLHEGLLYGLLVHKKKELIRQGYPANKIEIHRYEQKTR